MLKRAMLGCTQRHAIQEAPLCSVQISAFDVEQITQTSQMCVHFPKKEGNGLYLPHSRTSG